MSSLSTTIVSDFRTKKYCITPVFEEKSGKLLIAMLFDFSFYILFYQTFTIKDIVLHQVTSQNLVQ